jgi:DNA-binding NarL/FixJ family response regulator
MRVLVADDFGLWRRWASSVIREAGWEVVGEASDGMEAVEKAQQLQAHVVLLDIALPKLNGIEAAQQIRKVASESKILFASMIDSLDVVLEALNTGASGYIIKLDAGRELVPAIEAAFYGKRFVSSRLRARISERSRPA